MASPLVLQTTPAKAIGQARANTSASSVPLNTSLIGKANSPKNQTNLFPFSPRKVDLPVVLR